VSPPSAKLLFEISFPYQCRPARIYLYLLFPFGRPVKRERSISCFLYFIFAKSILLRLKNRLRISLREGEEVANIYQRFSKILGILISRYYLIFFYKYKDLYSLYWKFKRITKNKSNSDGIIDTCGGVVSLALTTCFKSSAIQLHSN